MPLLVHQLSLFTSIFFIHYLSYARFPIDFHTLSLHAALPISTPPPRTSRRSSRQSRTRQTDYNRVLYKPNAKLGLLNGLLDRRRGRWYRESVARTRKKKQRPIYNRLRVLRAETNLSRADLAAKVGVNPQTIGAIERGDHYPSLDLAMSLSEVFALPVEAVFNREPLTYSPAAYAPQQPTTTAPTVNDSSDKKAGAT